MNLEVRHLRAICAIARAGSVSRAATELGMSQPSLTATLQRIEKQLGAALFLRAHTGVVPTPLGDQIVRRAQMALAEFDHLEADLNRQRRPRVLRVGISQMECAPALIQQLDLLFPDDDPTFVVESSATALAQALAHGHHDLSVVLVADDTTYQLASGLSNRVVLPTVPIFVALSADHRLASQSEVDLWSLADEAWISPPGLEDGSLAELRAAAWRAGFEPRIRFTFPYDGGAPLIAAGQAVRLVEPSAQPAPGISIKPLVDDPIRMRIVLAWRSERLQTSQADQVYRALRSTYSHHARQSSTYLDWWKRRRDVQLWAQQLDAIFG